MQHHRVRIYAKRRKVTCLILAIIKRRSKSFCSARVLVNSSDFDREGEIQGERIRNVIKPKADECGYRRALLELLAGQKTGTFYLTTLAMDQKVK